LKIFLSHSTDDSFIAGVLQTELTRLGAEVFLDSRSLQTGDDFDQVIGEEIAASDEVLLLLSHASLKSHWVLLEVGAARALRKPLMVILNGVLPNDVPWPLNRVLARDLNQVEKYYGEVRQRLEGNGRRNPLPPSLPIVTPAMPPKVHFDVNDSVVISEVPADPNLFPRLNDEMKRFLGQATRIIGPGWDLRDGTSTFRLEIDGGQNIWADRWLSLQAER